jgi:hypothetical protein
MKKYYYVYKITNNPLNKHYIGYTSCDYLPTNHIGFKYFSSSKDTQFKVDQKQNPQNYKYEVIETFKTRKEAIKLEIELHKKYNVALNPLFYNLSEQRSIGFYFDRTGENNGMYAKHHTKESKKKISGENNGMYGKIPWNKGKKYIVESMSGENNPMYGKIPWNKGKKYTVESMSGENSPSPKKINIFDNKDKLMYYSHGNFKKICTMNNLPFAALKISYQKNIVLSFNQRGGCTRAYIDKYEQYNGWYARVVNK